MQPPQRRPVPARRGFFRSLAGEVGSFIEEVQGVAQLRLDELPALPDDKLALLAPEVRDGVRLSYSGGLVLATLAADRPPVELFRSDSDDLRVFACFDGVTTL